MFDYETGYYEYNYKTLREAQEAKKQAGKGAKITTFLSTNENMEIITIYKLTFRSFFKRGDNMIDKKNVKYILRQIKKAFDKADSLKEYEKLCECIYLSDCKFDYNTFLKLKKQVF